MRYTTAAAILTLATPCLQAVSIQHSNFGTGNQTILANSLGVPQTGLSWGIIVDTDNDGFDTYSPARGAINIAQDGFINGTDDYFFLSENPTVSFFGSAGTATIINFDNNDAGGVGGDNYAIIWSDNTTINDGDTYGFLESTVTIPLANDDITNLEFTSASPNLQTEIFAVPVPEPSSTALLGLAGLALVARRKR